MKKERERSQKANCYCIIRTENVQSLLRAERGKERDRKRKRKKHTERDRDRETDTEKLSEETKRTTKA